MRCWRKLQKNYRMWRRDGGMEDGNSVSPRRRCGMISPRARVWLVICLCLSLGGWGCTRPGPSGAGNSAGDSQSGTETGTTGPAPGAKSPEASGKSKEKKEKDDGQRYVGDIPLDVWFDDPLTIARNSTPVSGASAVPAMPPTKDHSPPPNLNAESKPPAPPAKSTSGDAAPVAAGDWKSLISGDQVSDETKAIRAQINTSLQTVSKYNGNYKEIQVEASTLAALAGIAALHADSINWKKDAPFVRDLAVDVGKQAKGLAQPNYDNTRRSFERLDGLLSGNRPADLGKAEPKLPFHEVASRGPLMRRMDRAFQMLKANINTEAALKSSADKVIHEATILATLSQVVATEGYTDSDQAEYKKLIGELIQSSRKVSAAAKDGDFAAFTQALSQSQKACNVCHQNFRFSDG
jgi:cytochrome c556